MCHDIKQLRLRLYTIQLTPENAEKLPFICINAKKVVTLRAKYTIMDRTQDIHTLEEQIKVIR